MTLHEQILQAVVALLTNQTLAGDRVARSKVVALARNELPAIVVKGGGDEVDRDGDEVDRRQLRIDIVLYGAGEEAESDLDPVIESVNQTLFAEGVLGDWIDLLQGPEISAPDDDDLDDGSCMLTLTYIATYFTPAGDLSTKF